MRKLVRNTRAKNFPVLGFFFLLCGLAPAASEGTTEETAETGRHEEFAVPLPIPPLLEGTEENGVLNFNIRVQRGEREFYPGAATPTLGYNGGYLGPTIRVHRGDSIRIKVENRSNETTTVHWHGAHVPARMDGGPHQRIEADTVWTAEFPIEQEAATLWYHPHLIPTTAEQVYRGLAGLFIVEDENSSELPLPRAYGENDIPLILQERRFSSDGRSVYRPSMPDIMGGYSGNTILVNGAIQPYIEVGREVVRLRLLNGSNSSVLRFRFEDRRSFLQIASDGGFLERPARTDAIVLSPGERAEVLVDFSNMTSEEEAYFTAETTGGEIYRTLQFLVRSASAGIRGAERVTYPDTSLELNTITPILPDEAERTRRFVMTTMGHGGGLTINGKTMDIDRIDERVPRGSTEIWQIEHGRGMMGRMMNVPHSFHVHHGQFQILSINGRPPAGNEAGWKDTVLLWPGDVIRIIKRFEDYTGIYMYHCHLLEHEDAGMMGQFEIVDP